MQKRDFIYHASIAFMPHLEWGIDKSIDYAERLWKRLGERGYTETTTYDKKEPINYYQKLSETQRQYFDQFWAAFAYKEGKQEAAMAWRRLGELTDDDYKRIISAAKQEAEKRKQLPEGRTPIMAQGWLTAMRFDDIEPTKGENQLKEKTNFHAELREIMSAHAHAVRMLELDPTSETWRKEKDNLSIKIEELKRKMKS